MTVNPIERHLLLEGIFLRYGYDFRQYAEASFDRRLLKIQEELGAESLLDVLKKLLHSTEDFRKILPYLTIHTTEFFRDPEFFLGLRRHVFPVLQTYPTLKIWVAGCSTGEEVYSLAIALAEEGLLERTQIYGTDINPRVLKQAQDGIFDIETIGLFAKNYVAAGGARSPSEYYTAQYGLVRFHPSLREKMLFTEHNLATDSVFSEMHLILCRNVLIYFDRTLQDRVFQLFSQSLISRGFLGIGSKESIQFSSVSGSFENLDGSAKIFRMKSFVVKPLLKAQMVGES